MSCALSANVQLYANDLFSIINPWLLITTSKHTRRMLLQFLFKRQQYNIAK